MKIDEGYIKYAMDWTPGPLPDAGLVSELEAWRRPLFAARLIGHYEDAGIGFGNISSRCGDTGTFVISGTQTGHIETTDETHYALVTCCNIEANTVSCTGPVKASSEAMTHAAIYALDADIRAVVHIHSRTLWERLRGVLPTTQADVSYGTPEMAREFARLYRETDFAATGIAVMAGHEEGLIGFGSSVGVAASRLLSLAHAPESAPGRSGTSGRP